MRSKTRCFHFGVSICALALSGCVPSDVGVPATLPAVETPTDWRADIPDDAIDVRADWWNEFGDPRMGELVKLALLYNTQVNVAIGRLRQAKGLEQTARGALLPSIGASASGDYSDLEIPLEIGPFDFDVTSDGFSGNAAINIAYEVDLFGRLRNQARASSYQRMGAAAALDAVKLTVASGTARAYLQLLALEAQQELLLETLQARRQSLALQRQRYETGYSSKLFLRQAEAEYSATQKLIPQTQLAITQTENAISVLTGRTPREIRSGKRFSQLRVPTVPNVLPSELLRRRPDVASAEFSLAAADSSLASARALFLPQISLNASGVLFFSEQFSDPVELFRTGGSILAPIFQGGRIRGQVEATAGARDQAAYAFRGAVLTALQETENSLSAVARNGEAYVYAVEQVESVVDALGLAERRYLEGYSSYLTFLDIQRLVYGTQQNAIQVRLSHLNSYINLYLALGGGWEKGEGFCERDNETSPPCLPEVIAVPPEKAGEND